MDFDVQDIQDVEMGMKLIDEEEEDEDTLGKSSRRTEVVKRPGVLSGRGGSVSNVIAVYDLMVLTIDFELDSDDEELLEELGYGSDASGSSLSISDFPF